MEITIRILADEPMGTVSPRLYGQFAEHLGRCCYDGLWTGTDFRPDVVEALKALPVPLLRWPGGCYADHYHWRDGIGPVSDRPVRLGLSCGLQTRDDNSLGTHEFMRLCHMIGAEPYLAGNMGSGSVQEMCDWVEYCNAAVETTLATERTRNGSPKPFGVRLWGVGNENWGCGGNYEPESYGLEYRRYACMLKHVDPSSELVVCGHTPAWNRRLVETLRDHLDSVDHFSVHRYWIDAGPGLAFSEGDYYRSLREAQATEGVLKETSDLLREFGDKGRIGIALDEWGVWHPEARNWGPGGQGDLSGRYEQANTLRDALMAAVALEVFHRACRTLSLANMAQIVNVLQTLVVTDGPRMALTPTYHLFKMHRPHIGRTALQTEVEGSGSLPDGTPAVTATATDAPAVTIINRHFSEEATIRVPGWTKTVTLLSAERPNAQNTPDEPDAVGTRTLDVIDGHVDLPPHSIATLVSA